MGEYADYEIDRWAGECGWGGGARFRRRPYVHPRNRNPAKPEDFSLLDKK